LGLARIGCEVTALTTNAHGLDEVLPVSTRREHAITGGFRVRYCSRLMRHSVSPALLRWLIPYVRWANIVHLTAVRAFPTIPTMIACRLFHKQLVWSPRGEFQRWSGNHRSAVKFAWELACRMQMPANTVLHVTSQRESEESLRRFPKLSAVVVPNGLPVPRDLATHVPGDGTLRVGHIGGLDPKKGIGNLLEACRLLKDSGMLLKLRIAGSGEARYEESVRGEIEAFGLGPDVEMSGHLAESAKPHFFQCIDLAVIPSHRENFGIAVADALAHGVPVVASTGTPWARVVEVGCGIWVDNSPVELARAIREMATAPLEQMGQRGRRWIMEEFSWERIAREMRNAYSSLLQRKSRSAATPANGRSIALSRESVDPG
jgi:glycosyltransferase involved in cell wall biosynthesis